MEVAQQLTLIDAALYKRIKRDDFLHQAWSRPRLQPLARNLVSVIRRLNSMSLWVATVILLHQVRFVACSASPCFRSFCSLTLP